MKKDILEFHSFCKEINEEYGGDIGFIPPATPNLVKELNKTIGWDLPEIFSYFLTNESNGLIIGNKRILSLKDQSQRKTWSDNIERNNDPNVSFWFKNRPQIFNDYLVVATDGEICFCFSKKYNLDNPSLYICENPNSESGVDFDKLDLDLKGLISTMLSEEFD